MKLEKETIATITSRLADLLSQYSYEFQHQRDREVASARGRYVGYLSALRDAKILDVQKVSDLTCLYVQVEGSPIEPPASIAECAELIKSVLK